MMLGCNPFDHPGGPNDIIKKILDLERKPITFPENFRKNFPSACHLMEGLLTFNPTKRMGCKNRGLKEIQAHAFFKGINWKKLQKREYETPFKPKLDACKAYQDQRESTCTNLFPTTPILLIPHKSKASNQESEELISQHEDPEHSDRNTSIEHDDSESQERLASQQEGPENSDKDTSIEHPSDRTHKTSPTKNFTPVTSINLVSIATSDHQQSATVLPRPVVRDSINFFNRLEGVSRKESMPENNQSARDADDDNEYPHYESITSVSSPCDGTSRENSPRGEIALSAIKKVSSKMLMKGSSSFGRPRAISKELEQEVSITLPNSFAGF
jgi:hypothetical protein